ncbi:MAG TPA: hypothetical protein VFT62_03890 [Mycobacteriales bacterium]|nr:hypothetical protein [Mycobacteriales bacterium]
MTVLAAGAVSGGTVGFLVVLALVIAAVLLFRSMLRHLRKVPRSFDDAAQQPPPEERRDKPAG